MIKRWRIIAALKESYKKETNLTTVGFTQNAWYSTILKDSYPWESAWDGVFYSSIYPSLLDPNWYFSIPTTESSSVIKIMQTSSIGGYMSSIGHNKVEIKMDHENK